MLHGKKILAIIPARGGSKGLPGKNIKLLCGKPLIGWTIEQAKSSKFVDEIFVSTDSQEIADIATTFGIKVPHLRPSELASDSATSAPFVLYTINFYLNFGVVFDYLLLLEPTSPLRSQNDIDKAIELAVNSPDKRGVVSLGEVHMEHPYIVKKIDDEGRIVPYINEEFKITQRQQLNKAYFPYGVIYLVKVSEFLKDNLFYGIDSIPYYLERWQCYEVDDIYDFVAIESIMKILKK